MNRFNLADRKLVLTGFMGSGKSSVGKVLAEQLDCRFVDLDAEIVTFAGCTVNEIFARDGEQAFRMLESSLLERILDITGAAVVATGGGAVLSEKNRLLMHRSGLIININVTLEQVLARLAGCNDRPLLAGENAVVRAAGLMREREQFYADSDIRIDTDGKSVEDVAAEILCLLRGF